MVRTPEEKVLEACYQFSRISDVKMAMKLKWGHTYTLELLELKCGDIKIEDYEHILPFCIALLEYSRTLQKDPNNIKWHEERLNMAHLDWLAVLKARVIELKSIRVVEREKATFEVLLVNYLPRQHKDLRINIIHLGKWETRVRQKMKLTKKSHEEVITSLALGR